LILQAQGAVDRAMAALAHGLALAEPQGYVRLVLDQGQGLVPLLREAVARGISAKYAGELLSALELEVSGPRVSEGALTPQIQEHPPLVETLTEREMDVLRLLPTELSSTEIAEELCVAKSTVRTHVKNIYGKLNVHRRWEAVRRAQEAGLL
jgi:LuxR family maltose regulon positive regulatory protein